MTIRRISVTAAVIFGLAATTGHAAEPKKYCVSNNHGAYVCFQPKGDVMWVKDTRKDGYAAAAVYETSYGRKGKCFNVNGAGTLDSCNFNMAEGKTIRFWAVDVEKTPFGDNYYFWSTERGTII